ncbi:MAG: 2-amino-4-hydroxy-6-hydroxymethyldihydropteridine diphosphokinase [Paludibacteraceae bacterium]|nr:2-amino-4-hydroxy-6-hydroxymethyldihydropteridine diphosphokinase [Paludibacteraceae bacterium]
MLSYLSLGSNLFDKEHNLLRAVALIQEQVGDVLRKSSFYYSAPWGFSSPNSFVNIVVAVETEFSPIELLHATQQIERQMGRTHKSENGHYSDRIIDIDILLYDNLRIDIPELKIPHPLMHERDFVMIPLQEIMQDRTGNTDVFSEK